jgi:mono/diheme cytochrome c family protein
MAGLGVLHILLAGALFLPSPASTAPTSAGRQVAEQKCAGCHAIGEKDSSPNPKAPPLRELNTRYPIDALREAFLQGLEVGHRDMPTFTLAPQEVTDIVSYLRSLDPCGRPSSDKAAMAKCFAPMKD